MPTEVGILDSGEPFNKHESVYQMVQQNSMIREGLKKKSWNFPTLSETPPPPKVGKYSFFFYMTRRANFVLLNFSHIRVMKHTISKNKNFQKKILYFVGAGTPMSLTMQPTLSQETHALLRLPNIRDCGPNCPSPLTN